MAFQEGLSTEGSASVWDMPDVGAVHTQVGHDLVVRDSGVRAEVDDLFRASDEACGLIVTRMMAACGIKPILG